MTLPNSYDIAIIGGGMVGASLALLLARKNPRWQIALLEARSVSRGDYRPSFDARSTAIAQGSVEILQGLGIWSSLAQEATAIQQVHVSDAGHFMGGLIKAADYQLEAVGYVIPNAWIGQVLDTQLHTQANIHFRAPAQVSKLRPRQAGANLQLASGEQINCKLAIIADGSDSPLRAALGIDVQIREYGQQAIIANVAFSEPHRNVAYERFTDQGPLALLPLGKSATACESALVLTLPHDIAQDAMSMSDAEFLHHLQGRFGHRLGKFLRVSERHAYDLQLISASEQVRSHIALVGNAAHFLHPVAGQGFNLSLRDCLCLVDALAQGEAGGKALGELSVLQHYLQAQQLDQQLTTEFSDKLVRMFSSASLPLIAMRHLGFIGLDLLPAAKTRFAAQTMGTAGASFL
jgi:2-polyprenylphenol 6-hydroxylase